MTYGSTGTLTCSVVIAERKGEYAIRLRRRRAARFIEADNAVQFAVCIRHLDRVRKAFRLPEVAA